VIGRFLVPADDEDRAKERCQQQHQQHVEVRLNGLRQPAAAQQLEPSVYLQTNMSNTNELDLLQRAAAGLSQQAAAQRDRALLGACRRCRTSSACVSGRMDNMHKHAWLI
jgi:hypothetical protein